MNRILIIEDETIIRQALKRLLERNGYSVEDAGNISEAKQKQPENFDCILADLRLPGDEGTSIIPLAQNVPVIIMTSYASVKSAVEAMRCGALDYISKPFDHDELLFAIARVLKEGRLKRQNAALKQDLQQLFPVHGMIGHCEAMQTIFSLIKKVAPTDMTALILGESGTGKELVARAIHEQSQRADFPLIAVNCANLDEERADSALFGHEPGAFEGALQHRQGLIEAAHGGTLFLDEIAELPMVAQARLLRVLEEKEIRPLGGSCQPIKIDMRLVAATNRDLEREVAEGRFRKDLYYRLKVMEIKLPPLRERGEDLIRLANHILLRAIRTQGLPTTSFSEKALEAMRHYPWPGNVRELLNAVERALILCERDEMITPRQLGLYNNQQSRSGQEQFSLSLDDYFRGFIQHHQQNLNETELAKQLGISRKALWERRQKMGISR